MGTGSPRIVGMFSRSATEPSRKPMICLCRIGELSQSRRKRVSIAAVGLISTITSPSCPVAETLPVEVEQKVAGIEGVEGAKVEITFEPTWTQDMMSEEAKLDLGFL